MEVVDSNEREMPAGRRNTEDFSAVRALQAPARCGPARVRHYIFDGVLLIGSGLMVPEEEVFVTLETVLTFRIVRPLDMGVADTGVMRDGRHYHDYRYR